MAVVIETTLGDITVDLYLDQRPVTCLNFLKLCKMKYYNFNLFHSIRSGFIAQTGDPTGEGSGGQSVFGVLEGPEKRFFSGEKRPKIRHTDAGLLSMVGTGDMMVGSQFFFTLAPDLDSLDDVHCVIGEVTEGHEVLRKLNDVICDETHRPYRDVRITHTVVLEDPFNDPVGLRAPSRSPSPSAERLKGGRIAPDEEIDETIGKSAAEIQEIIEEKEAKARATILEIVGDLPDADIAPPENVLFVCKLNPVTTDDDLEIIFSRFGTIVSCEVIRDKKTGDSLQYAFIEFSDKKSCEDAYFKMDNVLIDDRRIHVDFSQSVSKMRWLGKGRGVKYLNDDEDSNVHVNLQKTNRSQSREKDNNRRSDRNSSNNSKKSDRDRENHRSDRYDRREREKVPSSRKRSESPLATTRSKQYKSHEHNNSKNNHHSNSRLKENSDLVRTTKDIISHQSRSSPLSNKKEEDHRHERNDKKAYKREIEDKSKDRKYERRPIKNSQISDDEVESRSRERKEYKSNDTKFENTEKSDQIDNISKNKKEERAKDHKVVKNDRRSRDPENKSRDKKDESTRDHRVSRYEINNRKSDEETESRHKSRHEEKSRSRKDHQNKEYNSYDNTDNKKKDNMSRERKDEKAWDDKQNRAERRYNKDKTESSNKRKHSNEKVESHKTKKTKHNIVPRTPSPNTKQDKKSKSKTKQVDKRRRDSKKRRKPSTSSDSSTESSSSSESTSSSDDNRKSNLQRRRKKKYSTSSSSSSDSSSSSSSSSSDSSSTSSSSSDSDAKKKKTRKSTIKKKKL